MSTLTTDQKAPLLSTDGPVNGGTPFDISTSDPSVASIAVGEIGEPVFVVAQTAGTATITVMRHSDGDTAALDVEVVGPPFSISLGDPVPK